MIKRRNTRKIKIGNIYIGGDAPISVQTMTKTDTNDTASTIGQILMLQSEGCDAVRIAIPDFEAAKNIGIIKKAVKIPVIADIHFNWRLALEALKQGADQIRINPGNIGAKWKISEVVNAAKDYNVPIRIGVNAGSLEKDLLTKYGHPTAEAIFESAERHIRILQEMDYYNIEVSLKASNVLITVEAYRIFSNKYDYPLHIGISEAGPPSTGIIKSAVGIGILLSEGIGDTIRVSLTAPPEEEIRVAYEILKSLGIRKRGPEIISCPTCGRCKIDLQGLVTKVEESLRRISEPMTVAVMGCVVNGPGEAREADFGVAGGKRMGVIFRKGSILKKVKEGELLEGLLEAISEYTIANKK
ncbi:MAG: flavodoxin-dependent (E)-4-hydroxy-3-methylbut-2-enyl-diphosphate synthase [Thermodesulfovibrionales bacterium]|nr:flavodoxin-dependent (E)-4-hydroxy-3-methylbut-2-enyl-diphosphate synthase [Thermodesulfovibrionales bacterium]